MVSRFYTNTKIRIYAEKSNRNIDNKDIFQKLKSISSVGTYTNWGENKRFFRNIQVV